MAIKPVGLHLEFEAGQKPGCGNRSTVYHTQENFGGKNFDELQAIHENFSLKFHSLVNRHVSQACITMLLEVSKAGLGAMVC